MPVDTEGRAKTVFMLFVLHLTSLKVPAAAPATLGAALAPSLREQFQKQIDRKQHKLIRDKGQAQRILTAPLTFGKSVTTKAPEVVHSVPHGKQSVRLLLQQHARLHSLFSTLPNEQPYFKEGSHRKMVS